MELYGHTNAVTQWQIRPIESILLVKPLKTVLKVLEQ